MGLIWLLGAFLRLPGILGHPELLYSYGSDQLRTGQCHIVSDDLNLPAGRVGRHDSRPQGRSAHHSFRT